MIDFCHAHFRGILVRLTGLHWLGLRHDFPVLNVRVMWCSGRWDGGWSCGWVPGRHSCRNGRAWMFVFSVQEEPPTHPDSWFMFPDVSWTLRSGRKFLQMLLLLLQQRSIPLLFSVLRFHCFLMQMGFHSGWWGVAEGGAAPKMWAEICVGLLRNETRLEESLFWPNESVFFWGNLKSPFRRCLPPSPPPPPLLHWWRRDWRPAESCFFPHKRLQEEREEQDLLCQLTCERGTLL